MNVELEPETLVYDSRGLLPVVVQDVTSAAVLMVAYADRQAVALTLETGYAHFWSRSRNELWKKGSTSGNTLRVDEVLVDCDRDSLLVRAFPDGPSCHRDTRSCFEPNPAQLEVGWLSRILADRITIDSESSYTARLARAGRSRIAQKVGEEAIETVVAAVADDGTLAEEAADLIYHLLVLLLDSGVEPSAVAEVLKNRASGSSVAASEAGELVR